MNRFGTSLHLFAKLLNLIIGLDIRYLVRLLLSGRFDRSNISEFLDRSLRGPSLLYWLTTIVELKAFILFLNIATHYAFIMIFIINVRTLISFQALIPIRC